MNATSWGPWTWVQHALCSKCNRPFVVERRMVDSSLVVTVRACRLCDNLPLTIFKTGA